MPRTHGPDRTPSAHSRCTIEGVWCFERGFEGQERRPPVRLVVFDWDETLTLSTFLPGDHGLRHRIGWCEWAEYITLHNFETPFVQTERTRVEKLEALFADLAKGDAHSGPRTLAILTRNNQGVIACLNLLMMAGLDEHFSAIWCMAHLTGIPMGVYRKGDGSWSTFSPPFQKVFNHKADVLHAVCKDTVAWLPQLAEAGASQPLNGLAPEEIVLVDDVRTNFQSSSPDRPKILRYCKVARFDCFYRDMGFKRDMGGIGAKTDSDYATLLDFVQNPWQYKANLKAVCLEHEFDGCEDMPPVDLVVFDFDETLTLHTWMPTVRRCATEIGWRPLPEEQAHFVEYNFASPYVDGDRVAKLGALLRELAEGSSDGDSQLRPRALAVLTRNEDGAVAVLNLLSMAGLDGHFAAIWTLGADTEAGAFEGAYREGEVWRGFELPIQEESVEMEPLSKLEVLRAVVAKPEAWFPQLAATSAPIEEGTARLRGLESLANLVLVDDEPSNFRPQHAEGKEGDIGIVRRCEVTRYDDDDFRGKGLITHMGGLGAKTDEDYRELLTFVRSPWRYREAGASEDPALRMRKAISDPTKEASVRLERTHTQEELDSECSPNKDRRRRRAVTLPPTAPG